MSAETVFDIVQAVLLCAGTALMALGAVGVLRMPDVYTRAQASSKTSTLGLLIVFLAVALHFGDLEGVTRSLAVIGFALVSVPVAAHMITRAAHRAGVAIWPEGATDELRSDGEAGTVDGSEPPATRP